MSDTPLVGILMGSQSDAEVMDVRAALFGSAEGNWVALNHGHDIVLPGSANGPVGFLMYPQAEIAGVRQDELDPDAFHYEITVESDIG